MVLRSIVFPLVILSFLLMAGSPLAAQEREDRTLLGNDEMRAIINEASGERAMHVVQELVPYPRVRPREEFISRFRESDVMLRFARDYGFTNPELEVLPQEQPIWNATRAELWMVQPEQRKLYDVYDVAVSVVAGSESGDVTAALVDVGSGARAEDYTGKDVKGKIVLGAASAVLLQRLGVFERGALGVLSYNSIRTDSQPDEILTQRIGSRGPGGAAAGFAWSIAPRVGRRLAAALAAGEPVTLRSVIRAESYPGRMEVVHATIPGDGSSDQLLMVSAHLYEGYQKQGANDDNSGCAATIEMGRTLLRLISEGQLPRPRRTIHFLWVPEISGTRAWLNRHPEVTSKLIADLNFDMEGLSLARAGSFFVMHRTPDTLPTFLNDVGESVLRYVGDVNQERVRYRSHGYAFTLPVVAPNGTLDPLYYRIDKYYGSSDHAVYISQGIPALLFVTWPDPWYHSSEDTPDKLDSTMFKRAVVIGAAAAQFVSSAGDEEALRAAAESLGRAASRLGEAQRKALSYIAAADFGTLASAYREARVTILHEGAVEKKVVQSAAPLFDSPADGEKRLAALQSRIDELMNALLAEARAFYQAAAEQRQAPVSEPAPSDAEKEAAELIAERVGPATALGEGQAALSRMSPAERRQAAAARRGIPETMLPELNVLLGRHMTVLEIRDFLSGEFEPLALDELMSYLRYEEKIGRVKLTPKAGVPPIPLAPEPARPARKPRKSE